MKIVSNYDGDYKDGYNTALRIEKYSDNSEEVVLFVGIQCAIDKSILAPYVSCERKILLDLWSPCSFFTNPSHFSLLEGFDEIYSICPFTCEWTNKKVGRTVMKYSFYPVSLDTFKSAKDNEKTHDVYYAGNITGPEHECMINIISKFNYIFASQGNSRKVTHRSVSNSAKLALAAKSKIGLVFNKLYLNNNHLASLNKYDDWQSNKAFEQVATSMPELERRQNSALKHFQQKLFKAAKSSGILNMIPLNADPGLNPIAPQFKTRVHELALCKTLILCHRDPWNLIEDYYEPNKEFIYFNSIQDLQTLIPEILAKYDSYKSVIDNAYKKVTGYSTTNLLEMIKINSEFKRAGKIDNVRHLADK